MEPSNSNLTGNCGEFIIIHEPASLVTTFELTVEICDVRANRPFALIIQLWDKHHHPMGRHVVKRCLEGEEGCCLTFNETFYLPVIRECCNEKICGSVLVNYLA